MLVNRNRGKKKKGLQFHVGKLKCGRIDPFRRNPIRAYVSFSSDDEPNSGPLLQVAETGAGLAGIAGPSRTAPSICRFPFADTNRTSATLRAIATSKRQSSIGSNSHSRHT